MRTTLVIEDSVMRRLKALAGSRGVTLSSLVEDFLQRGLRSEDTAGRLPARRWLLPSFGMGAPLVDVADREALEAAMERKDRVRR